MRNLFAIAFINVVFFVLCENVSYFGCDKTSPVEASLEQTQNITTHNVINHIRSGVWLSVWFWDFRIPVENGRVPN